jgi:peptide/nickel transport system permease protein
MIAWLRAAFPRLGSAPKSAWVGLAWLAAVAGIAIAGPWAGYPIGADVDPSRAMAGPSTGAWLGADHLGRPVLPRLLLASGAFTLPAAWAVVVAALAAVPTGAIAGWSPGVVASGLRAVFATIAGVPPFVSVLMVLSLYGPHPAVLGVAVGLTAAPALFEGVRARVDELVRADVVAASLAHGLSPARILVLHLVVGASGALIARHLLRTGASVLVIEVSLAYLGGLGVQEPQPSWGNMMAFDWGRGVALSWMAPAAALWLTAIAATAAAGLLQEPTRGR